MATSKKVTELVAASAVSADDLIYVVDDPSGTPTSKKATAKVFLESNVAANVAFAGPVIANYVVATVNSTPANSTAVPSGYPIGSIWSDGSYIYVVTGASALKRVAISTW